MPVEWLLSNRKGEGIGLLFCYVLLGLLLLILLLLLLRFGVLVSYGQEGAVLKLCLGWLKLPLYPSKPKKRKTKRTKPPKQEEEKPASALSGSLALFLDLLPTLQTMAEKIPGKLRIDRLVLSLDWGEDDPADAAIHYGYAWAVAEQLMAWLEARFLLKKREISIRLCYEIERPMLYIEARISMTGLQLLSLFLPAVLDGLRVFRTHKKKRQTASVGAEERKNNNGKTSSCD